MAIDSDSCPQYFLGCLDGTPVERSFLCGHLKMPFNILKHLQVNINGKDG